MSEIKPSFDTEPLELKPSQEAIADPSTAWHAIRGYDFAGLEAMLDDGLLPSENQQDHLVCLSVSPSLAWSTGREANSFYAYALQDSISLAVQQDSPQYPMRNHGGFVDEIRKPFVPADDIKGLMLPDGVADLPLTEVVTSPEPHKKPLKARQHLERTLQHIEEIGGTIDEELQALVAPALDSAKAGNILTEKLTSQIERALMTAYSDTITQKQGVPSPTVGDAIKLVLDRLGKKLDVLVYTDEQKQAIGLENARMAVKNQSRGLGGLILAALLDEDIDDIDEDIDDEDFFV